MLRVDGVRRPTFLHHDRGDPRVVGAGHQQRAVRGEAVRERVEVGGLAVYPELVPPRPHRLEAQDTALSRR